jgi:hypothetical protein
MNEKQPDNLINESNILIEDDNGIQAPKSQIQRKRPTNQNSEPKKPEYLNYEQVIELIKNNSPLIQQEINKPPKKRAPSKKKIEIIKTDEIPTPPTPPAPPVPSTPSPVEPQVDIKKIRKKREKKPATEAQLRAIKKACEVRDKNRAENKARKEALQAEYDKLYQEKVIAKAVAIKKNQLKRERKLAEVKDEPIDILKQEPKQEPKQELRPKKNIQFF